MSGSTLYGLPDCGLPCWREIVLIANLTCFFYYVKPTSLHWNDLKFKYYNIFVQTSHDLALPCFSNLNFNHFPFTLASVPVRLPYPSLLTLFPLLACVQYQLKHLFVCSLSCVWLFGDPMDIACQGPQSMGFPRQEYWSGLPCPFPEDLPDPGIEPTSPALEGGFFTAELTLLAF